MKKYKELHRRRRKGKSHANAARIEKSPYKIVNSSKTPHGKENNEMQYFVKEDHFLAAGCARVGEALIQQKNFFKCFTSGSYNDPPKNPSQPWLKGDKKINVTTM